MDNLNKLNLEEILMSAPNLECDCGNTVFDHCVVIKQISNLVSPSGKDEVVPVDVFVCRKCGKVISSMFKSEDNCRRTVGDNVEISAYKKKEDVLPNKSNKSESSLII